MKRVPITAHQIHPKGAVRVNIEPAMSYSVTIPRDPMAGVNLTFIITEEQAEELAIALAEFVK